MVYSQLQEISSSNSVVPCPPLSFPATLTPIYQRELLDILKKHPSGDNADSHLLSTLRNLHSSCQNTSQLKRLGLRPILQIVRKVQELTTSNESNATRSYRLASTLAYLHSLGEKCDIGANDLP
jgi:hypothetical protein